MTNQVLAEFLLHVGDSQLILSHRLAEWCGHAPELELDIALANIGLDLLGQARTALSLAGEVEGQGRDEDKLAYFRTEAFYYTLQPPLLGRHSVDEFLFVSRRGFCEHYAAAFVVLMRAAGIPARVVTGYQGGEINPHDGFLVVRQSDAHAWAEVWLAGRGWVRVDPTAAVAPERIERGLASALPAGEPLPFFMRASNDWLRPLLQRWEALNNAWQQQVLGYDQLRQQALLQRLGLPGGWQTLAWLLASLSALGLVLLTTLLLYQKRRTPAEIRLWQHALRRTGVHCAPAESPLALATRLARENPEIAQRLAPVIESFVLVRYAPDGREHLATLRAAVAALGRRRTP